MKKLFCLFFLFFLVININADTAKITSYYLVKSNVAQDIIVSIINNDVEVLRRIGFGIKRIDDGNPNDWVTYLVRLTMNNRTWYRSDIGAIYCTFLLSDHTRKWAVYTYINKGDYYTGSSELVNINYSFMVYELTGFGNLNLLEN